MSDVSVVEVRVVCLSVMSKILRLRAINVGNLHDGSGLIVSLFLGFWAFNVLMGDCVSYELWRRNRPGHNMGQIVLWIQRIIVMSRPCELDTVRRRLLNVEISQVILRLVQSNVQSSGCRSLDVPVLVAVFRSVLELARSKLPGLGSWGQVSYLRCPGWRGSRSRCGLCRTSWCVFACRLARAWWQRGSWSRVFAWKGSCRGQADEWWGSFWINIFLIKKITLQYFDFLCSLSIDCSTHSM